MILWHTFRTWTHLSPNFIKNVNHFSRELELSQDNDSRVNDPQIREWSFIPGGGGLEPRRGGSLWIFENKREGRNDRYEPYWGGPSKNVVAYVRYVRIFINLVGFRMMKFQNFLQPWWKRTFLIYAKLDESGSFWLMRFQNIFFNRGEGKSF